MDEIKSLQNQIKELLFEISFYKSVLRSAPLYANRGLNKVLTEAISKKGKQLRKLQSKLEYKVNYALDIEQQKLINLGFRIIDRKSLAI